MTRSEVTDEVVRRLFSYTPEYAHLLKVAKQDIGKEIIDRIEEFLKERKRQVPAEVKKIVFEDASKVPDRNINSILDAFIKIRSQEELDAIEQQSLDNILILFNNWLRIGHSHTEVEMPQDLFSRIEAPAEGPGSIEEQVAELQRITPLQEIYQSQAAAVAAEGIYSPSRDMLYAQQIGQFIADHAGHEHDNQYTSNRAVYRMH